MSSVTLAQIRLRSREKADMVNSKFIEPPEHLDLINESYFTWYDMIVSAFEDYFLEEPTEFVLAAGVSQFPLPADFYKLAGIDKASDAGSDRFYPLRKTKWRERNRTENSFSTYALSPITSYRIIKDKILFTPKDGALGSFKLWYIPVATPLVLETDSIDTYNGFENLLILDVAIKMLNKEESDPSMLMVERARIEKKMQDMLIDRDISGSERIEEVDGDTFSEERFW